MRESSRKCKVAGKLSANNASPAAQRHGTAARIHASASPLVPVKEMCVLRATSVADGVRTQGGGCTLVPSLASYSYMKTVNERSQFNAAQMHMQTVQNFLHTVISPQDALLREATQVYALALKQETLPRAA